VRVGRYRGLEKRHIILRWHRCVPPVKILCSTDSKLAIAPNARCASRKSFRLGC
jgi:hypothetical protein